MAFKTIAAAAMCCAAANGASDMEVLVRDTMHTATAGGDVPRLDEVQAAIAPTFQAMPKNQLGRLESEHVRHVLHRYFTSQRGWTIAGLDDVTPEGEQPLAARAQRTAEEARRSRGLALSDVAAVALAVEGAVGGELQELLQASFEHNQIAVDATLDASSLETVLTSFLGFLTRGMQSIEEAVSSNLEVEALASMPRNAVKGASASVSFDGAMAAAHRMMESFSHWQGWRCAMTKATLQGLGAAPAVSDLYRYGLATEGLPFTQSPEYLREIGALDDTDGTPRVRIPNYMQGPSNCLSATPDLAFCCPSACDAAVARIHGAVQGPVASAEQLREVVPGIQVEADSDVELHGPAFAALMRGAMPEDCPAPAAPGALLVARWAGGREFASSAEMAHYLLTYPSEPAPAAETEEAAPEVARSGSSQLRAALRAAVMILIVGVSLRWIAKVLGSATAALSAEDEKAKKKA